MVKTRKSWNRIRGGEENECAMERGFMVETARNERKSEESQKH